MNLIFKVWISGWEEKRRFNFRATTSSFQPTARPTIRDVLCRLRRLLAAPALFLVVVKPNAATLSPQRPGLGRTFARSAQL
jgi:hypothetical protein